MDILRFINAILVSSITIIVGNLIFNHGSESSVTASIFYFRETNKPLAGRVVPRTIIINDILKVIRPHDDRINQFPGISDRITLKYWATII